MTLSRRARALTAAVLLTVLAAACGSGGDGEDADMVSIGVEAWEGGSEAGTAAGASNADQAADQGADGADDQGVVVPPAPSDPTDGNPALVPDAGTAPAATASPAPGTQPGTSAALASAVASGDVDAIVAAMDRDQLIGQMLVGVVFGDDATDVSSTAARRNTALYGESTPAAIVARYHLGGVIYLAHEGDGTSNVADLSRTAGLSAGMQQASAADTGIGLLIAADQEGGRVVRLRAPATVFPAAREIGDTSDAALAAAVGRITGQEALNVGVNWVLAPVADVNVNPANPVIGDRAFGVTAAATSPMVAATAAGLWEAGALPSLKHWPGHGDTDTDSHVSLPTITHSMDELRRIDFPPFQAAIEAVPMTTVMTGHLNVPAIQDDIPATLSKAAIDLLRTELDFDGIVVTDAMNMGALQGYGDAAEVAVRAIEAGNDMILFPSEPFNAFQAIRAALDSGRLTEDRLRESARRILRTKQAMGVLQARAVPRGDAGLLGGDEAQQVRADVRAACGC